MHVAFLEYATMEPAIDIFGFRIRSASCRQCSRSEKLVRGILLLCSSINFTNQIHYHLFKIRIYSELFGINKLSIILLKQFKFLVLTQILMNIRYISYQHNIIKK